MTLTAPAASLSPPKFPFFCERDVSKETVGIILRKEPRPWVGADGGLGLWEAEAGCSGPWRRQGEPGCPTSTQISQKASGQDLEALLYQRRQRQKMFPATQRTKCGLVNVFASPMCLLALKMCQPWPCGLCVSRRPSCGGWERKQFGLRFSPELRTAGVPVLGSSFTHWLIRSSHTHRLRPPWTSSPEHPCGIFLSCLYR